MNKNPERHNEEFDAEQQAIIDEQMAKYTTEEIPSEKRRECGPEVEKLEEMFNDFEKAHDLEMLAAITTEITNLEEAQAHPTWRPAQLALNPIYAKFRILKDETNITNEKHAELKTKWKRISQAVGFLNNGRIDHSPR